MLCDGRFLEGKHGTEANYKESLAASKDDPSSEALSWCRSISDHRSIQRDGLLLKLTLFSNLNLMNQVEPLKCTEDTRKLASEPQSAAEGGGATGTVAGSCEKQRRYWGITSRISQLPMRHTDGTVMEGRV